MNFPRCWASEPETRQTPYAPRYAPALFLLAPTFSQSCHTPYAASLAHLPEICVLPLARMLFLPVRGAKQRQDFQMLTAGQTQPFGTAHLWSLDPLPLKQAPFLRGRGHWQVLVCRPVSKDLQREDH